MSEPDPSVPPRAASRGLSRRGLFAGAGAGVALGALAGAGGAVALDGSSSTAATGGDVLDLSGSHEFYTGLHQAGIDTTPQRYCVFMTFDISTSLTSDLQVLFARWSAGIAQMMQGLPIGTVQPDRAGAVAQDTGEALDLEPSSLTVTLGLGPGLFDERFGLADKKPKLLADLPHLPSDQLRPELTGGDLSLQACADASAGQGQSTPRNLLGFKDGTRNIKDASDIDEFVWVGDDDVAWMKGGAYQVARKIRMDIEVWDSDDVTDQEQIFARSKTVGAPLTGTGEFDTPDFTAKDSTGALVIDPKSHVSLAAFEHNGGTRILRRGYNFTDGLNDLGQLDAGLLFLAYMNDPAAFVKLQTKLGSSDRLNEYIAHIGSAVFAVPPAPTSGSYLAKDLFA
jgi:deferrochelatase/peroxidase EfeB